MDLGNGLGHLTYSTLVHPGDNWEQMWHSLTPTCRKVKARIAGNEAFGVSHAAVGEIGATLAAAPTERDKLKKFLSDNDMYHLHRQRLPLRRVQGNGGQRAGLRAGLALGRTHPIHHQRRRSARRCVPGRASRPRSRARRSASSRA